MKISNDIKLTLLALVVLAAIMPFDMAIFNYVSAHPDCRPFYEAITDIGLGKWYTVPTGLLFILGAILWKIKKLPQKLLPLWRGATLIFFAVAGAGLVTDILKRVVARARPIEFINHQVTGPFHWHEALHGADKAHFVSFPSGHSTTIFAFATAVSFLIPEKYRALRVAFYIFAALIAFSRLVVQAHYASDVMAGMIIGCWGGVLAYRALQTYNAKYNLAA